jgi:hypothetical protein
VTDLGHRIFPRQPDGKAMPDPLVVSIEFSEVESAKEPIAKYIFHGGFSNG